MDVRWDLVGSLSEPLGGSFETSWELVWSLLRPLSNLLGLLLGLLGKLLGSLSGLLGRFLVLPEPLGTEGSDLKFASQLLESSGDRVWARLGRLWRLLDRWLS